jgi:pyruvate ferredoxin oxidoreductase delta subunit
MNEEVKKLAVYSRGIVSDEVGKNIVKILGLAASKEGIESQGFGRYGDSPERVFIPTSAFIRVGNDLEQPPYELIDLDVIVVLDDTLLAHNYVLKNSREDAFVIINTRRKLDSIKKFLYSKKFKGKVALIDMKRYVSNSIIRKGEFFIGNIKGELDKFEQDFTVDYAFPPLGAIAKTGIFSKSKILEAVKELYSKNYKEIEEIVNSVYNEIEFQSIEIKDNPIADYNLISGINKDHWFLKTRSYKDLPFGLAIPAVPKGSKNKDYKTFDVRPYRPVIDYNKCTRCELCWIWCPDTAIDYEIRVDYDYCKGCGICAKACPSKAITMVNEIDAMTRV